MSREDPIKAEKDFSATLDEQFPLIEKISDYKQALDKYLVTTIGSIWMTW